MNTEYFPETSFGRTFRQLRPYGGVTVYVFFNISLFVIFSPKFALSIFKVCFDNSLVLWVVDFIELGCLVLFRLFSCHAENKGQ